ncbi:hypothetical protein [Cypionkella aquatica]|nr:hypothetical protein [Cypionkella aquatica]
MREMMLGAASAFGIGPEVAALMEDRHDSRLQDWPLSRLLSRSREISGLSKTEVARRGGPSRTVVKTLENPTDADRLRNPPVSLLVKLSEGYGLPLALVLNAAMVEAKLLPEPGSFGGQPVRIRKRKIKPA